MGAGEPSTHLPLPNETKCRLLLRTDWDGVFLNCDPSRNALCSIRCLLFPRPLPWTHLLGEKLGNVWRRRHMRHLKGASVIRIVPKQIQMEGTSPDGAYVVKQRQAIIRHPFHHCARNAYHRGGFNRRVFLSPPPWRELHVKQSTIGK